MAEAITKKPQAMVQKVQKQVPKYVLQAQEVIVDVPTTLNVERPVEVPQIMTAEAITQVPVAEVQIVEKAIPRVTTEAIQTIQEVPQVLIEEMLVEVPQVQMAEAIKQVPKEMVQARQRGIPVVQTQVREIVQAVSVPLINEVAIDVPQVQVVEVMKQTAALSQQRLVQTSRQYELETAAYRTMPEERAGVYQAQVIGVVDKPIQQTAVERLSNVMVAPQTYAENYMVAPQTYVETVAPTYFETGVAATTYGGNMVEYVETVPMMGEVLVAPTTMMGEVFVAPTFATEMLVSPTVFETFEQPMVVQQQVYM